jgi:ubiquinone/menaquinone biosynthesis C-methylase UbiE
MIAHTRFLVLCVVAIAAAMAGSAQQTSRPGVHPISGRFFADVMSFRGASWLDREERDIEEAPDAAIDALELRPGLVVADVGAGSGYMTIRMAERVGGTGRVYATDIQPQMITLLQERLAQENITNVTPVLGLEDDPKLPSGAIDLILLVDVYHEFSEPQKMLRGLRAALKPGGRLVLLEYRKEDPSIPILEDHKMSVAVAKLEVEAEGFTLSHVDPRLPRQHVLVFEKTE